MSWAIYNRPMALSILFHPVDEEQVRSRAKTAIQHPCPTGFRLKCWSIILLTSTIYYCVIIEKQECA